MFPRILAGEHAREREACRPSIQTTHYLEEGSGYFKETHYPDCRVLDNTRVGFIMSDGLLDTGGNTDLRYL